MVLGYMARTNYVGILLRCQVEYREPWQNQKLDRSNFFFPLKLSHGYLGVKKHTWAHAARVSCKPIYLLTAWRQIHHIYILASVSCRSYSRARSTEYGVIAIYAYPGHEKLTQDS